MRKTAPVGFSLEDDDFFDAVQSPMKSASPARQGPQVSNQALMAHPFDPPAAPWGGEPTPSSAGDWDATPAVSNPMAMMIQEEQSKTAAHSSGVDSNVPSHSTLQNGNFANTAVILTAEVIHSTPNRQSVHGESRAVSSASPRRLGEDFFDAVSSSPKPIVSPKLNVSPKALPSKALLSPKGSILSPKSPLSPLAVAGLNLFRVATADPTFNDDIWLIIFQMLVQTDAIDVAAQVCKQWHALANSTLIWRSVPWRVEGEAGEAGEGTVNWQNFRKLRHEAKPGVANAEGQFGLISTGTEGVCFKCRSRSSGEMLAVKRARVYPQGEGVAYYMLRELAVLQDMQHPHINSLCRANLQSNKLYIFFPYVERTLQDVLVDTSRNALTTPLASDLPEPGSPSSSNSFAPIPLTEYQIQRFLHQLLDATSFCHRRGVYHRNLKPKHLLIHIPDGQDLDSASLKLADFALVRRCSVPQRTYTSKVVTLWYRAPEILMGVSKYSNRIDVWSVGCVFAEMALGRPLLTGSSEIGQLFQMFDTLGTPNDNTWPGFSKLPNYGFAFPKFRGKKVDQIVPTLSRRGCQLLELLLKYDPTQRISAESALNHPFFGGPVGSASRVLTPAVPLSAPADAPEAMPWGPEVHYMHAYLRTGEQEFWPLPRYLSGDDSNQPDLLPLHRAMCVDWLIELVDVFDMFPNSAFLAVAYADTYLSMQDGVERTQLQLVAAACLHMASKCEDTAYISVNDLVSCSDNLYTSAEVLAMEESLLTTLNFRLSVRSHGSAHRLIAS
jgi:serine/threonine protein kinase